MKKYISPKVRYPVTFFDFSQICKMTDYTEKYKTRLVLEKLQNWKIFEYLVALENGAIMWSDISNKIQGRCQKTCCKILCFLKTFSKNPV